MSAEENIEHRLNHKSGEHPSENHRTNRSVNWSERSQEIKSANISLENSDGEFEQSVPEVEDNMDSEGFAVSYNTSMIPVNIDMSNDLNDHNITELSRKINDLQLMNQCQANHIIRLERQLHIMYELKKVSVTNLKLDLLQARSTGEFQGLYQEQIREGYEQKIHYASPKEQSAQQEPVQVTKAGASPSSKLQVKYDGLVQSDVFKQKDLSRNDDLSNKTKDPGTSSESYHTSAMHLSTEATEKTKPCHDNNPPGVVLKNDTKSLGRTSLSAYEQEPNQQHNATLISQNKIQRLKIKEINKAQAPQKTVKDCMNEPKSELEKYKRKVHDLEQQLTSLYKVLEIFEQDKNLVSGLSTSITSNKPQALQPPVHIKEDCPSISPKVHSQTTEINVLSKMPLLPPSHSATGFEKYVPSTPKQRVAHPLEQPSPTCPSSQLFTECSSFLDSSLTRVSPNLLAEGFLLGFLIKKDKQAINNWERLYYALHGYNGVYSMTYSNSPNHPIIGTINNIRSGISSVTEISDLPIYPQAFALYTNRHDVRSPVLYAVPENEEKMKTWMSALSLVCGMENTTRK